MPVFDLIKDRIKSVLSVSSEAEEFISLKQKINKIEQNIYTQNGIKYYQFDAVKLNGNDDILIIIIGYNGSINGYGNKYFRIAAKANELYGNTVFIIDNNERNWHTPESYFDVIISYVKENMLNEPPRGKPRGICCSHIDSNSPNCLSSYIFSYFSIFRP